MTRLEKQDDTAAGGGGTSLTISDCAEILTDAHMGDSISINGRPPCTPPKSHLHPGSRSLYFHPDTVLLLTVHPNPGTCLTITSFSPTQFTVGVSPETLRRTNLGSLIHFSPVNLERAVSATTRMGGHFVQGHVDTVAKILSVTPDGNSLVFRLQPREKAVLRYVVEKGYVTLDGASLTVTAVDEEVGWWEVMLIAYTQERVVMAAKREGEEVNVEVDMVGKYVEKSVRGYFEGLKEEGSGGGVLKRMVEKIVDERMNR